jgi:hypothetical protein
VNIGMSSPGWAFDVSSVDFRGYVYMERGVSASLVSRWKWVDVNGMDMKGKVCMGYVLFCLVVMRGVWLIRCFVG